LPRWLCSPPLCSSPGVAEARWIPPEPGRIGTGRVYCGYRKSGSSYTITFGFYASGRRTGLAFCRAFHPPNGYWRDVWVSG
jgi:hypothetical protein